MNSHRIIYTGDEKDQDYATLNNTISEHFPRAKEIKGRKWKWIISNNDSSEHIKSLLASKLKNPNSVLVDTLSVEITVSGPLDYNPRRR